MQPTPARFRELHASGTFIVPNPWDVGSARLLEALGAPALATTSSGLAKAGAVASLWDVVRDRRLTHRPQVRGGVLESECAALLTEFFARQR